MSRLNCRERGKAERPGEAPIADKKFNGGPAFYKFVLDSVPVAVVTMDSSLSITGFNHWAEKVTGYTFEEALGKQCRDILKSEMCHGNCPVKTILDASKSTVFGRTTIHNREGKAVPVNFNAAALFNAEGKLIGAVEAFMDITNVVTMERERANLISMLAHDMRSSITGIHGLGLRLLRRLNDLGKEEQERYLEIITKEAATLESLIDDFLDLSSIEAGRLKLNIRATSLDEEIEKLFETYRVKAAQQGIRLDLQVENVLPIIEADPRRLHRVFTNLLDNAIKFSGNKGTITIRAVEKETEVMVAVTDEGIGIAPEDLPDIFDVFHRGRTAGGTEGYGLGLATVKTIVEGHGGRVEVANEPNAGTTFTVFLPKR
ncbi:MAG: PAS domain-containing sensor histidine kinase [Deltaproteobacteria bacterium]|jgi:two-component system phosphate regulon sensor histidine kinase PhoR|nr:PAS domain-containing sensor histidine kinase [Deltaproteobacteria bacterium]